MRPTPGRPETTNTILAIALGAACAVIYGATLQKMPLNDGYLYIERLQLGRLYYNHLLYLPFVATFRYLLSPFVDLSPEQALLWTSALTAGAGVSITYFAARRFVTYPATAFAAAILLAFLPGYWFHATTTGIYAFHGIFAALAVAALMRCAEATPLSVKLAIGIAVSISLVPMSHLSGAAVGLVAVGGAFLLRRVPRAAMALLGSLVLFFIVYQISKVSTSGLKSYEGAIVTNYYQKRFSEPEVIPLYLQHAFEELFLYSVPASVYFFAGLRVLWRKSRNAVFLLLLWILGYFGICALIGDRYFGSYYISTFAAQIVVAAAALEFFSRSIIRSIGAVAFAIAPALAMQHSNGAGLIIFAISSLALWAMARQVPNLPEIVVKARFLRLLVPGIAAFIISITTIVPNVILLPNPWEKVDIQLRTRVRSVLDSNPAGSGYLVIESEPIAASYWNDILSREHPEQFFIVMGLDVYTDGTQDNYIKQALETIEKRIVSEKPIWVIGDDAQFKSGGFPRRFMDQIRKLYQFEDSEFPASPIAGGAVRRLIRKT
ncbi:MAG: hypothetical protein ACKVS6_16405 [Planctomycetota bacterium]